MRKIKARGLYKRDYKKLKHDRELAITLKNLILLLANDQPLSPSAQDHALAGVWDACRECHIRPDILLIYEKEGADLMRLTRIGSHSELFG